MDSDSFRRNVMPCINRMYRIALCLTGNEADAADAVQEACMKLWEHRDKLDSVNNIEAYTIGTVRNVCIDALGKRKATTPIENAFDITSDTDTERSYETSENLAILEHLILHLPDNQRTVMTMRDIEGCTVEEIEKATGYTKVNIRVLLSRARTTIRKKLII